MKWVVVYNDSLSTEVASVCCMYVVKYSETHNNSEHQTEYTVLQEKRQ